MHYPFGHTLAIVSRRTSELNKGRHAMKRHHLLIMTKLITSGSIFLGCLDASSLSSEGSSTKGKTTTYNKFDPDDTDPTACGQTDTDLAALYGKGYVYAAAYKPKCGQVYSLTVDGGCVDKDKCTIDGKFVRLEAYASQPKTKTISVVVVDACTDEKCKIGRHFDLGHYAISMDPFKTLKDNDNIQSNANNKKMILILNKMTDRRKPQTT